MNIGIFASQRDPIQQHFTNLATQRGDSVLLIDTIDLNAHHRLIQQGTEWSYNDYLLSSLDAIWVRQYPAEHAPAQGDPKEQISLQEAAQFAELQRQRSLFAQSALLSLEFQGIPLFNPFSLSKPFDYKPHQMERLAQEGFVIPDTIVTNSVDTISDFIQQHQNVVMKPISGGDNARLVGPSILQNIKVFSQFPMIFQKRIHGEDIRVTIVNEQIVSSVSIPTNALDYRSTTSYRHGKQQYNEHTLPAHIQNECKRAAKLCHCCIAGIDLKYQPDGTYVFIEVNSSPVYLDIENKTKHPITAAILNMMHKSKAILSSNNLT